LLFSIGLALLASLAFGAGLTFWHAGHKVQTEVKAAIAVGTHVVRNALDDSMRSDTNRRQLVERLIAGFDGDRHLRAYVLDRDNQVRLASNPEPPKDIVPAWFQRLLGGDLLQTQVRLPAQFGDYSSVLLATDPSNELAEAWSDTGLALAVLATFCTLVLGVVYWTVARGLRSLRDLSVAFARVGRGDYSSSIAESGPMELAYIAREFNQMVTRLSTMRLQNDRLNEQLRNVQEKERASLSRELHDEIGPFLFAVGLDASALQQIARRGLAPRIQRELAPRLDAIRDAIAHMQKHLKLILGRLRPTVLLDVQVCREELGERAKKVVFLIVREALSNALRHGDPRRIEVKVGLEIDGMIRIAVADDGGGMRPTGAVVGYGIIGMQERAASLSGTLTVCNRGDEKGVIVAAELPVNGSVEFRQPRATEAISA
jgi:two-component system sensor histidine kinase UhpB